MFADAFYHTITVLVNKYSNFVESRAKKPPIKTGGALIGFDRHLLMYLYIRRCQCKVVTR